MTKRPAKPVEFEAFLVKIVCPKGRIRRAKQLLRQLNKQLPQDFEIDEEYEGVKAERDFYGERSFAYDPQIVNEVKWS